jgi:hypothetical protein
MDEAVSSDTADIDNATAQRSVNDLVEGDVVTSVPWDSWYAEEFEFTATEILVLNSLY